MMRLPILTLGQVLLSTAVCTAATLNASPDSLQLVLIQAQPGDTVVLTAGKTYSGNFTLPAKFGTSPILITTSRASDLPSGVRISPAHASMMARVESPGGGAAFATAASSKNWIIRGLEIAPSPGTYAYDLVNLSSPTPAVQASLPANVVIDQCYIHGDPTAGSKRGVAVNGINLTVRNSYISNIRSSIQDAQAIAGWSGPGPISVTNNYLEASGENVMFGGAAPSINGLIPSDIRISGNHLRKPPEWKGTPTVVKNLLELKNAQRVEITGNLMENNWTSGQNGFGILFTVRTCEAGDYWWAAVRDVTFESNIVRNTEHGINILGSDNVRSSCPAPPVAGQVSDINIRNNLFDNVGLSGSGTFAQILSGASRITVEHNTVFQGRSILVLDGMPSTGIVVRNNIFRFTRYGIKGSNVEEGLPTIGLYSPTLVFEKNILIGFPASYATLYPAGNFAAANIDAVGFADASTENYQLASTSPYKSKGSDAFDPGADIVGLATATVTASTMVQSATFNATYSCTVPVSTVTSPSSAALSVAARGGLYAVTDFDCGLTGANTIDWIAISSDGSHTVLQIATNNTGAPRSATVSLGEHVVTVQQQGSQCTATLKPLSVLKVSADGTGSTPLVQPLTSLCSWSALSYSPGMSVSPANGSGSSNIYWSVYPNFGSEARILTANIAGATVSVLQDGSTLNETRRFIRLAYYSFLGRLPRTDELDFQELVLSQSSRASFVLNLMSTPEFNGLSRFVAGVYVGILTRDPEYSGYQFQRQAVMSGAVSRIELLQNFLSSAEFVLHWGNPGNDDFVRILYNNVLLRTPTPDEVKFQSGSLATVSRPAMAYNFLQSQEFLFGNDPRLTTFLIYAGLLLRDPRPFERTDATGRLRAGEPRVGIIQQILSSPEFTALLK